MRLVYLFGEALQELKIGVAFSEKQMLLVYNKPTSYPAECQSMTAGMRAGCPAVAHSCAK